MDNLQHAYSNLLTQGGQLLSNIGKGVSSAVGNVGNAVSQDIQRIPQVQQFNTVRQAVQTPQFQQNVVKPVTQYIQQTPQRVQNTVMNQPLTNIPGFNFSLNQAPKQLPITVQNIGKTLQKVPTANQLTGTQRYDFGKGLYDFTIGMAPSVGRTLERIGKGQVLKGDLGSKIEDVGNLASALPLVGGVTHELTGATKLSGPMAKAAEFLSKVGTPEDKQIIMDYVNHVQTTGGKTPPANSDIYPTIQSLTKNLLGKDAVNLNNKQLANVWDTILQNIGKRPNKMGLGLSTEEITHANAAKSNPEVVPQGGEPLPWENAQGQTSPEFASKEQNAGVKIPTDKATQQTAETRALLENLGKVDSGTKQTFADWVNQRKATNVEGLLKQREFSDLNNKGLNGIFEFQAGNKIGRFGDVQKYFDQKYNEVKKAGIELNYKKDYLPQLWNNSQQEVEQVFGRSLGTKPSFSMDSIIKNYEEGIKAGLTPRFNTIGDLAGWYEQRANKAIADMNFFTKLGKDGFIQPAGKAPRDWVSLNPDTFPKVKTNINGETYNGVYKAPRELADMINNYLYSPQNGNTFSRALNGIANFVSRAKNITLSFGVPGTGINAHGFNILARHTLGGTGGNPITRLLTGAKYMLHPGSAVAELDKTLATAPEAVKNGLTLSAEEHTALLNQSETFAKSFGKNWNNLFEKPLFNKMIPALKLSSYNELVKNGTDAKAAAKLVNNVYGGMNWEQMGRNRDTQNLLRTLILAPDWAESTVRLGGNLGKSFVPTLKNGSVGFLGGETGARYRTMATTILGSYVALNIANKLTSGHYAFQNDPGHTFELEAGYTQDGQKRYLKPYGTSVDFLRLPFDTAVGLAQGDPTSAFRAISNRLSIPLGAAMHLLTNVDYKGQPIYGQDKYGNKMTPLQSAEGVGAQVVGAAGLPSFIQNAGDVATGKQGVEQGLTQGLELPFRYSNLGHSNIAQQLDPSVNLQGKDLYDFNKQLQGQSKFSDNQMIGVNQSSNKKQTIQDMLDVRKMTSDENKVKKQLLQGGQADSGVTQAQAAEKVINNKIYYTSAGSVKTIDLNPPTKGSGIDAYTNQNWQYAKAREVFASPISDAQKQAAYKQLGVTPSQVEYDYKASKSTDIKSQYVLDKAKTMSHQDLVNQMVKGRQESVSGTQFANNGVIDALNQAGYLSNAEAKGLKSLKYDKNGNQVAKVSSGKVSAGSLPKIPKLHLVTPRATKVRASRATTYTLKAPKLNIAPIPRFGSSLPKARKVRLSA